MRRFIIFSVLLLIPPGLCAQDTPKYAAPAEVRASFKKALERPKVPLDVKIDASVKSGEIEV